MSLPASDGLRLCALCAEPIETDRLHVCGGLSSRPNAGIGLPNGAVIVVETEPERCAIRVWNEHTRTWWRADLIQETPHRQDNAKAEAPLAADEIKQTQLQRDELLEACRYMHKLLVDMGHGGLAGAILGENAIAKAEGRS